MSTGDDIGAGIETVGSVVSPIVNAVNPAWGAGITLAFKALAVVEPAAYNAVAALFSGKDLTPEQTAEIARVEAALDNPDSYLDS